MTPLPPQQKVTSILGGAVFYFWRIAKRLLQVICFIIIALGVARLLIILFFALYQKFGVTKKRLKKLQDYTPKVSILIPAYNEATVICNTLSNVLTSTYKNFEAIVIDDGSSDQTAEIARNQFGDIPNIKIIQQENGGKAAALNNGISHATGEIIIIQDADTLFDKHALEYLVKHFHNPEVAGVSGNVKVGNTHNIMGRCQAVEYITSQSLDRRAFDVLNCIVIVPGAIGARRKSVLEQVGGLKSDTLAEDCDLTVQVLRTGNRIVYEDKAVAWTEAPETVGAFLKQRFRWLFGILQVCWKNKDLVFNLRHFWLGWFSLPYMVLSLIIYPLIIPLVDLVALYGIRIIVREFMSGRTSFQQSGREIFALFTLGFVLLDRIVATIAFSLEKDKDFPLLITLPLQRIVYRFLLYRVGIKVLYIALTGKPARRNKLKRTGSATVKS